MSAEPPDPDLDPDINDYEIVCDITSQTEEIVKELLDKLKHKRSSEVRGFMKQIPKNIFQQIFPKPDDVPVPGEMITSCEGTKELLPAACRNGDIEIVKLLLFQGVNPNSRGKEGTSLEVATLYHHTDIIDLLIKCEPDLLKDISQVKRCLAKACQGGHRDLVKFWLDRLKSASGRRLSGADFVAENDPLIAACKGDHPEIADQLLEDDVFFINKETVTHAGEHGEQLTRALEVWVVDNKDEKELTNNKKTLVAKWSQKHLHTFEPVWLQLPKYEETLTNIDLSHNALGTIPGLLLWGLPWLHTLTLSHNKITKLPAPVGREQLNASRLRFLTLSNNQLHVVPSELFLLQHLETLSLAHNKLSRIQLANMELKLVTHNDTDEIAWKCHSLQQLDLSNNKLKKIPAGIKMATQLTKLDIANNEFTEIPQPWYCPLVWLKAQCNKITSIPEIHLYWQKSLMILNLSKNNLSAIPLSVCRLSRLVDLNLSHNQIEGLPPAIGWCTYNLSQLDLSHNALRHIKDTSNATDGKKSLLKNTLRKITDGFSRYKTEASQTQPCKQQDTGAVFYVPLAAVEDNQASTALQLEFPKVLNNCLCTLDLSHNSLQCLPDTICDMKALQALNLRGNPELKQLPSTLSTLTDLYSIKLEPDQITDPPEISEAISQGTQTSLAILHVLRQKLHTSQSYRGMKIMLVGPEKSGKTSLLTHMTGCDYPEDDRGINVMEWNLPNPAAPAITHNSILKMLSGGQIHSDSINFTLWDLKGGDSYTVIHQTLFTPHTLYLLVWDVTEKETGIMKLRPWIQNVKSTARESCIIAVGTHTDLLPKSVKRQDIIDNLSTSIHRQYPEIAECVWIESGSLSRSGLPRINARGINEAIYSRATKMTFSQTKPLMEKGLIVGRKVPSSYIVLKDLLAIKLKQMQSSTRPPIMTEAELTKYIDTIPDSHLMTRDETDAAVIFLRDTGSLTHVSDHTYQLTNLYFLDPAWLCDVLMAVVTFKPTNLKTSDGMVLKKDLKILCTNSGFGDNRFDEYLQLLGRFEIALAVTGNRYLMPALLPNRPPVVEQTHARCFTHQVHRLYKMAYIPPGFWSRLVSRLMVNVKQRDEGTRSKSFLSAKRLSLDIYLAESSHHTTLVWQEGISITCDNGQIVVEPFPNDKIGIKVTVRNKRPDFKDLGFVVDHIESLIKEWYPGLDQHEELVERLIPCPICERHAAANEGPYGMTDVFTTCNIFPFKNLVVSANLRGAHHERCSRHSDEGVSLKEVVPDLFLADLGIADLDMSQLTLGRKLGQGGFGVVYKAEYKGQTVAVKTMLNARIREKEDGKDVKITDSLILKVMNSVPALRSELHVTTQWSSLYTETHRGIYLQLVLRNGIRTTWGFGIFRSRAVHPDKTHNAVPKGAARNYTSTYVDLQDCTTAAIAYLHKRRVIHTDLKTDNILLFSTDTEDLINVKLADYGISHNLVAGGVRGNAGGHVFSAPEITKGKAFDEKADLFSLGMLLYHIMSGVIPFGRAADSIQTKLNITTGTRPKFEHRDYSVDPRFAHLEGLMRQCWGGSPTERPSAEEALKDMQNPSFLCLRHCFEVESEDETCLYTQRSTQDNEDTLGAIWLWRKRKSERCVTAFNLEYSTADQEFNVTKEWPGDRVLCAVQFGDYHVLGTKSENIEIYKCSGQDNRLTHQKDIKVPIHRPVTSLFYQPLTDQDSDDNIQGRLFVGLEDGSLLIYSHHAATEDTTSMRQCWKLKKTLVLSVMHIPCSSMLLIDQRQELLVGCGKNVRILSLETPLILDSKSLVLVTPKEEQHVGGMVSYGNLVWCFVNESCYILQFDITTRQLTNRFHCSGVFNRRGQYLSNAISPNEDEYSTCAVSTAASPVSPGSSSNDAKGVAEITSPRPLSVTESIRKHRFRPIKRQRSKTLDSITNTMFVCVTSLLTVKDTMWVGRSSGDILVVGIDPEYGEHKYKFGEILAVLYPNPKLGITNGPVTKLVQAGLDKIVACRDIVPEDTPIEQLQRSTLESSDTTAATIYNLKPCPYKQQFLMWQDWGSQELEQFERSRGVLH